ncbi:hypothetical protein WN51_02008 [Melipona quadrifasciata]|uniref:Uncharacterized protein n=1 Tax=Melipona quadrifasciata TaxID=166423 RepID=A0A0M9AAV7_9HYME|nr:hypothetical protein WN51_02008 [Melipona quadrifasciata]
MHKDGQLMNENRVVSHTVLCERLVYHYIVKGLNEAWHPSVKDAAGLCVLRIGASIKILMYIH